MTFNELDRIMRTYECSIDQVISPEVFLLARLDGHGFTRLTKKVYPLEAPFDERFRDMMIQTAQQLMDCGFRVVYAYTQSDEISLLFHRDENAFGRKVRKWNTILSGTASAAFSLQLGQIAVLDCRIIPLPDVERVQDYFLWRQEDANRNSLNAHCYWLLRKEGIAAREASVQIEGVSIEDKKALLLSRGICFDDLPMWQRRGVGIYQTNLCKKGWNPLLQKEEETLRRKIHVDFELPCGQSYADLISSLIP